MSSAVQQLRKPGSSLRKYISLVGAGIAVGAILLNLGFFFRPGTDEVLRGLAHHAFILGWLLVLTAGTRTVSFGTLGMFWLFGVWGAYGLAYLIESPLADQFGAADGDVFVPVWWAPAVETTVELLPVVAYLLLASRGILRASMSDALLLGFVVGAGVSFQEDAHVGDLFVSGSGWAAATPWTVVFPSVSPVGDYFALNHALWATLCALSIGPAVILRHLRWIWPLALVGPLLAVSNHIMANEYATFFTGLGGLLNRGQDVPWVYSAIHDVTGGGRLPMVVLIVGVVVVMVGDRFILRWMAKRDDMFPQLPSGQVFGLLRAAKTKQGFTRLVAADRYSRLRRSVYFYAWQTLRAGSRPVVTHAELAGMSELFARTKDLATGKSHHGPIVA